MPQNPYEAPKSEVKDRGPVRAIADKPAEIIYAVWLLWLSIPLGIPATIYEYQRTIEEAPSPLLLPYYLGIYLVFVMINVGINRGRNWARILFLALAVFSLLVFVFQFDDIMKSPIFVLAIYLISLVVDGVVTWFLFSHPGRLWFRFKR